MFSAHRFALFLFFICLSGCTNQSQLPQPFQNEAQNHLFAAAGNEKSVTFQALYKTSYKTIESYQEHATQITERRIQRLVRFLFGPLTRRNIAGIHLDEKIEVDFDHPVLSNGAVFIPFTYRGKWMLHESLNEMTNLTVPLPFNTEIVFTPLWKNCTDSAPDHATESFYWYFWDPARTGCDHVLNQEYQNVDVIIGAESEQTILSYPEYESMIRLNDEQNTLSMTFAFGYVEDPANPNPFFDFDYGMREFQKFNLLIQTQLGQLKFQSSNILASEYDQNSNRIVGRRWTGMIGEVKFVINVVAAAGIDQMDLFAKSYAIDHEGFFGWFGHSRVGSGFDADRFEEMVLNQPQIYSLSPAYQLIYWAGCNSYSYYTTPFFQMKAMLNLPGDLQGTKYLDIMSNALPSLFAFNAFNAKVMFDAILHFQKPTSYQDLIQRLEQNATNYGTKVMVNVIGDEDNP